MPRCAPHLIEEEEHALCQTPHEGVEACGQEEHRGVLITIIRYAISTSAGFPSTSRSRTGRRTEEEERNTVTDLAGRWAEWVGVEERGARGGGERGREGRGRKVWGVGWAVV